MLRTGGRWLERATGALMLAGASAASAGMPQPFIPMGDTADAPTGFVQMCARDQVLCWAGASAKTAALRPAASVEPVAAAMPAVLSTAAVAPRGRRFKTADAFPATTRPPTDDATRLALVRKINSQVNRQVIQLPDSISAGVDDRWNRTGTQGRPVGDCEDIAIEKRMRLIEAGIEPERLFLAVVYRRRFGLHTVLAARLDEGDYVLDSLNGKLLPWDEVRYSWIRVQTPGNPMEWRRIQKASASTSLAASTVRLPHGL